MTPQTSTSPEETGLKTCTPPTPKTGGGGQNVCGAWGGGILKVGRGPLKYRGPKQAVLGSKRGLTWEYVVIRRE